MGVVVWIALIAAGLGVPLGLVTLDRRGLRRRVLVSLGNPELRRRAVEELCAEIVVLKRELKRTRGYPRWLKRLRTQDVRLALAELLIMDGRPAEALEHVAARRELLGLAHAHDPPSAPLQVRALLALRQWEPLERALRELSVGHPTRIHSEVEMAMLRGETDVALARLDSSGLGQAEPLLRARVLAAGGRATEEVWRLLSAVPRWQLEMYVASAGDEPAAQLARRVLDGHAYR